MKKIISNTKAATSIEYAVIASLLSIIFIAGALILGEGVENKYNEVGEKVEGAVK